MRVKCEYCEGWVDDQAEKCPACGAPNRNYKRIVNASPKTIEELQQWYLDRHLPPEETTRFFIGKNYKGPRAFGIYEENGRFVVYKNKADGSRAVRYEGTDQAYAVNEIYMKLKSEIISQKANQAANRKQGPVRSPSGNTYSRSYPSSRKSADDTWCGACMSLLGLVGAVLLTVAGGGLAFLGVFEHPLPVLALIALPLIGFYLAKKYLFPNRKISTLLGSWLVVLYCVVVLTGLSAMGVSFDTGSSSSFTPEYYSYQNTVYCSYGGNYYEYDDELGDYFYVADADLPPKLTANPADYEYDFANNVWDVTRFTDSDYYEENLESYDSYTSSSSSSDYSYDYSSDNDSDYDWDWGSDWDSDSSDWDSDW